MSENKVQASPSARRLAKELGVDLSEVYKKIGNKRIQAKDVERYYYEGPDENTVRDDVDEAFSLAEEPTAQDNYIADGSRFDEDTVNITKDYSEENTATSGAANLTQEDAQKDLTEELKQDYEYIKESAADISDSASSAQWQEDDKAGSDRGVSDNDILIEEDEAGNEAQEELSEIYADNFQEESASTDDSTNHKFDNMQISNSSETHENPEHNKLTETSDEVEDKTEEETTESPTETGDFASISGSSLDETKNKDADKENNETYQFGQESLKEFAANIELIVRREIKALRQEEQAFISESFLNAVEPNIDKSGEPSEAQAGPEILGELYAKHISEKESSDEHKTIDINGSVSASFSIAKKTFEDSFFERHIGYNKGLCETFVAALSESLKISAENLFGKANVIMVSNDARTIKRSVDLSVYSEAGKLRYDSFDDTRKVNIWILDGCELNSLRISGSDTLDIFVSSSTSKNIRCDISCSALIMDMQRLIHFAIIYKKNIKSML